MQIYRKKSTGFVNFVTYLTLFLYVCPKLSRKRGNDKATESAVVFVGGGAEETGVGTGDVFVCGFAVLDVAFLPIGETVGIGHLRLAEAHGFGKRADGAFAALGEKSGIGVLDSISVRATVAGAHDDAFFTGEFATEMVKRQCGFYFCHMSNKLRLCYYVISTKSA